MLSADTKFRVRYAETDQMGYVYYGNYATYYEVGRVEAMRKLGVSYKDMEAAGYLMPVIEYQTKYLRPVFYDEEITVRTLIKEFPRARIRFDYECYKESGELANTAHTILVFISKETGRPCPIPEILANPLKIFIATP